MIKYYIKHKIRVNKLPIKHPVNIRLNLAATLL